MAKKEYSLASVSIFYKCLLKNSSAKNSSTFFLMHDIIIEC